MAFTYDPSTNAGRVRLLVADTDPCTPIWSDEEVQAALEMESSQGLFVSGPGSFGTANVPVVPQVYSVYRSAALLMDSLASNSSRLSSVTKLLDVELSVGSAAKELRDQAGNFRAIEAKRGNFAIAEIVSDEFSFRERWFKSWERQGR